jgi:hypothetical protein
MSAKWAAKSGPLLGTVRAVSGFSTRWVVRRVEPVAFGDLAPDGALQEATLRRWVDAACDDYLARCARLSELLAAPEHVAQRAVRLPGALAGATGDVVVTARATEVWPAACRLSVRVRSSDAALLDASCVVSVCDRTTGAEVALGADIRDELIALEHTAEYFN